MAFLGGTAMRFKVADKEIFHEAECEINGSTEFKEIATKDTVGTEVTPGTQSFTGSVSGIVSIDTTVENALADLLALWKAKTLSTFTYTDGVSGHVVLSGSTYIENFTIGATTDESVTFSYSLKGSGELVIGTVV